MLRKLRIAFSAVCGIVCLLLVALWLRSYRWQDVCGFQLPHSQRLSAMSMRGQLSFRKQVSSVDGLFRIRSYQIDRIFRNLARVSGESVETLNSMPRDNRLSFLVVPHWFHALAAALIAPVPWIKWRFSLRTLLIATTLAALVLGAIVYAVR